MIFIISIHKNSDIFPGYKAIYYGLLGQPVTLPCKPFELSNKSAITFLEWRKCIIPCRDNWEDITTIMIKRSSKGIDNFQGGSIDVSPITGHLTLLDFNREDEGLYSCIWDKHNPYHVQLLYYNSKYTYHYISYTYVYVYTRVTT